MRKLSFILLFFTLISSSCFYSDIESNKVEVTSSYSPNVTITSNFDELDTIVLIDSLLFTYNIEIDTGQFYFAEIYINSYRLKLSDTIADSIWIYTSSSAVPGQYDLTLIANYKAYTGSLADAYNAELLTTDASWTINLEPAI